MCKAQASLTAQIFESKIAKTARIFKDAYVSKCILGEEVTIGDRSRLTECVLDEHVVIQRGNVLFSSRMGRYTSTMMNTVIFHSVIGAFCAISWNVSIGGAAHDYENATIHGFISCPDFGLLKTPDQGFDLYQDECVIGNDVWIAAGASIKRGVRIGDGAVIGANAVVTHDVEPYTIVAGCPARPIKKRFSDDMIARLRAVQWWNFPTEVLARNVSLFSGKLDEEKLRSIERLRGSL